MEGCLIFPVPTHLLGQDMPMRYMSLKADQNIQATIGCSAGLSIPFKVSR